jgi:hypothetical protein
MASMAFTDALELCTQALPWSGICGACLIGVHCFGHCHDSFHSRPLPLHLRAGMRLERWRLPDRCAPR